LMTMRCGSRSRDPDIRCKDERFEASSQLVAFLNLDFLTTTV
jgi:hypothetical protein